MIYSKGHRINYTGLDTFFTRLEPFFIHPIKTIICATYLVLEEPASDVVSDGTGVVVDLEVSLGLALLGGLGLAKGLVLAQVLAHHLLQVGLVSGLGDDALFLQHGQDTHLLLNQLDSDDQVHTKVDESPLDTLLLVLFLLLDEHVVVEELLETLVGVVDEELLQDVEIEDLEAGDVEDT